MKTKLFVLLVVLIATPTYAVEQYFPDFLRPVIMVVRYDEAVTLSGGIQAATALFASTIQIPSTGRIGIGTRPLQLLHLSGAPPRLAIQDTDSPSDDEIWDLTATGGILYLRAVNDAYDVATTAMQVSRTGSTISNIIFPTGNVGFATMTAINNVITVSLAAGTNPITNSWDTWSDPAAKMGIQSVTPGTRARVSGRLENLNMITFYNSPGRVPNRNDYKKEENFLQAFELWNTVKEHNKFRQRRTGINIKDVSIPDEWISYDKNGKAVGKKNDQILMDLLVEVKSLRSRVQTLEAAP